MGPSLANKNKGGISAHDVCRSIPRTKLLTAVVCNSISHPCAPPAHRQVVSRSAGRSLAALAVAVTCEMADTSAAPVPGACGVNRGNVCHIHGQPLPFLAVPGGPGQRLLPPRPVASRASSVPSWSLERLLCRLDKEGIKGCFF